MRREWNAGRLLLRAGLWAVLLWALARPWTGLGGLVDERLRWWALFALAVGPGVGLTVGDVLGAAGRAAAWPAPNGSGPDWAGPPVPDPAGGRSVGPGLEWRRRLLRFFIHGPVLATALAVAILEWAGLEDTVLAVSGGLVGYVSGLDLGLSGALGPSGDEPGPGDAVDPEGRGGLGLPH